MGSEVKSKMTELKIENCKLRLKEPRKLCQIFNFQFSILFTGPPDLFVQI